MEIKTIRKPELPIFSFFVIARVVMQTRSVYFPDDILSIRSFSVGSEVEIVKMRRSFLSITQLEEHNTLQIR